MQGLLLARERGDDLTELEDRFLPNFSRRLGYH